MVDFVIIELEDGLSVVEVQRGQSPEEVAASRGGTLIDPGPYSSYEDACDALDDLQYEDEDRERARSVPAIGSTSETRFILHGVGAMNSPTHQPPAARLLVEF